MKTLVNSILLVLLLLFAGISAAYGGSSVIHIDTDNSDNVLMSGTPQDLASQFPSLNGGILPTLGQDGDIGYVSFYEAGLAESPLGPVIGSNGPLDIPPGVSIFNTAVWEFTINQSESNIKEIEKFMRRLKSDSNGGHADRFTLSFVKDNWFIDPWLLNLNANIAIPIPLSTVCTSDEFTINDIKNNNGWILVFCDLGGNIVPVWSLNEFFVDPKPFIKSGQIADADEFVPFGIRLELLPLNFHAFDPINPTFPATTEVTKVQEGENVFSFAR